MNNFSLPLFMQVKPDALAELKENLHYYLPGEESGKVLILTTEGLLQRLQDKVVEMLSQLHEYKVVTVEKSSFDFAVMVAKKISMEGFRLIIGFGGGTALDTAKYAGFVSNIPYIAIPTALSNDGVCSPVSVLLAKGGRSHSFTSKTPDGLLIDTDIIRNSPRLLMQAGVGDVISNYTALYDWTLDCRFNGRHTNDFAYMLSERAVTALLYSNVQNFDTPEGIQMLAQSLVMGGLAMQIAGNSRPCSGPSFLPRPGRTLQPRTAARHRRRHRHHRRRYAAGAGLHHPRGPAQVLRHRPQPGPPGHYGGDVRQGLGLRQRRAQGAVHHPQHHGDDAQTVPDREIPGNVPHHV